MLADQRIEAPSWRTRDAHAMVRRMFCRYVLRTTDAAAGRAFYAKALDFELPDGRASGTVLEAWPLHEQARAAGAPSHWLGQIEVDDVGSTVSRIVALGGQPLGPTMQLPEGAALATLRDPFGTVIGVRGRSSRASNAPVAWHQLHTTDADGAWKLYQELFGWAHNSMVEAPGIPGEVRLFAWLDGGPTVGGMGNSARLPGVHPHWLYFFPVDDIERATAEVRAHGGTAMAPIALPSGLQLAACEDPQRAAFGLAQLPG